MTLFADLAAHPNNDAAQTFTQIASKQRSVCQISQFGVLLSRCLSGSDHHRNMCLTSPLSLGLSYGISEYLRVSQGISGYLLGSSTTLSNASADYRSDPEHCPVTSPKFRLLIFKLKMTLHVMSMESEPNQATWEWSDFPLSSWESRPFPKSKNWSHNIANFKIKVVTLMSTIGRANIFTVRRWTGKLKIYKKKIYKEKFTREGSHESNSNLEASF